MLRAAIYCRCSTEEESQIDALKNQVAESEACVQEQGWFLIDRYVESKSGTTTKGRTEYNRLFDDLALDKFDVIVIKSQDRLMRNVKDWYLFLDRMLTNGKRLFMYIDRKFYSADDALITGIKAILAEEYSRELSKKINNAHRNRQKGGGKVMLTSRVFGFEKNADGSVSVVDTEAEIIKEIYEYCAAGYGSRSIANILLNQGCRKRNGAAISSGFIGRMIRNPLYKGVLVMNRLHYDFDTKQTIKTPESEWIYGEGAVPAIVSEELWEQANSAMTGRAELFSRNGIYRKGSNPGKFDLSGKIICGFCGKPYYRTWRRGYADREEIVIEWKCSTYLEKGRNKHNRMDKIRKVPKQFNEGCDSIHLDEKILFSLLEQVSDQYYNYQNQDKESIINHAVKILHKALAQKTSGTEMLKLEEAEKRTVGQKERLLTKLLDGVISDDDYRKKNSSLEEALDEIRLQRDALKKKEWEVKNLEQRIEKIKNRLQTGGIERATAAQMLQDISCIVVHEWNIDIVFDPLKIMGLSDKSISEYDFDGKPMDKGFTVTIDYPFASSTERGRYLDKQKIITLMKDTPNITAKKIAVSIDRPVKLVQNRIKELRLAGCIRFNGSGGHGEWEVLNAELQFPMHRIKQIDE